jgi:hypothetical protein
MPTDTKSIHALVIVVRPHKTRAGEFDAWLSVMPQEILCTSDKPFFCAARKLSARGYARSTILEMKHAGSDVVCLRASLAEAVGKTVDEHKGPRYAPWKPFPHPAGSPIILQIVPGGEELHIESIL